MRKYELGIVFNSSLEEDKIDREIEKQTSLLEKENCAVEKIDKWGVRRLAYPIKKQENGFYVFIYFTGNSRVIHELDRINRINDIVLRHLIVKSDQQ